MQVKVLSRWRQLQQSTLKKGSSGNGVEQLTGRQANGQKRAPDAGAAAELDVIGARQILTAKPLVRQRLTA